MRILHYSLGFPPYRTGGLTKFCMDLMKQQIKSGHEVALLWPGQMGFVFHNVTIRDDGVEHYGDAMIRSFEVINPLPISYDEGIREFDKFIYQGDEKPFQTFLDKYKPDVIHIHTLMGLHTAFLKVAKEKSIKLIFTAHDFFPICPKVTMFRHNQICDSIENCNACGVCNATALSIKTIKILQSPIYRKLKDITLVRMLRKQHRDEYLSEKTAEMGEYSVGTSEDFKRLRTHYHEMIMCMDIIHYNSSVTKAVYEKYFGKLTSIVIPISHANIADHRKIKSFSNEKLRIRYLGPCAYGKGFFCLKAALDKLWNERQDFSLDVQFVPPEISPYIKSHGRYNYSELDRIFDETDVLVAPSIWYETFGYTVLEALSYGVPVIVTETVGAKDILADGAGIVIDDAKSDQLFNAIKGLNADMLHSMNKVIVDNQSILTIKEMSDMIEAKCYR